MASTAPLGAASRVVATDTISARRLSDVLLSLRARLGRRWLDRGIAGGVDRPDDRALALREAQLVGRRERRRLARCFERVLTEDAPRRALSSAAPIDHDAVTVARPVLTEIILGLFSSEAVEARGVALGWRLLTNACSPLYASRGDWTYDRDRLWHEALSVLITLRPSTTTGATEPVGCPQPWAGEDETHAQSEGTLRGVSRGR